MTTLIEAHKALCFLARDTEGIGSFPNLNTRLRNNFWLSPLQDVILDLQHAGMTGLLAIISSANHGK